MTDVCAIGLNSQAIDCGGKCNWQTLDLIIPDVRNSCVTQVWACADNSMSLFSKARLKVSELNLLSLFMLQDKISYENLARKYWKCGMTL